MKNKKDNPILDLKQKLINKAIEEWADSIQSMSPEDILIKKEELKRVKIG